jgi:hypothetical protein
LKSIFLDELNVSSQEAGWSYCLVSDWVFLSSFYFSSSLFSDWVFLPSF